MTAVVQTMKPDVYPRVDDEATIIIAYPRAQGIVQASWNWPFNRKDMEVYGATGQVITVERDGLRVRLAADKLETKATAARVAAAARRPDDVSGGRRPR